MPYMLAIKRLQRFPGRVLRESTCETCIQVVGVKVSGTLNPKP